MRRVCLLLVLALGGCAHAPEHWPEVADNGWYCVSVDNKKTQYIFYDENLMRVGLGWICMKEKPSASEALNRADSAVSYPVRNMDVLTNKQMCGQDDCGRE